MVTFQIKLTKRCLIPFPPKVSTWLTLCTTFYRRPQTGLSAPPLGEAGHRVQSLSQMDRDEICTETPATFCSSVSLTEQWIYDINGTTEN